MLDTQPGLPATACGGKGLTRASAPAPVPPCVRRRGGAGWPISTHSFFKRGIKTIVGEIKYGPNGEWAEPGMLEIQFHDVAGHDLDQFKTDAKQTILWPARYATGSAIYPYPMAKK
jgi:hypothetical protein